MKSNIIIFPGAKTKLYNDPIKINKKTVNEVVCLVCDNLLMNKEQERDLNKRVRLYEEIKDLLPPGKKKLLLKYEELQVKETDTVLEEAINYILKNENQINDILASNY